MSTVQLPAEVEAYEFIIWDLDGTLVNLDVDWYGLMNSICRKFPEIAPASTITEIIAGSRKLGIEQQVVAAMAQAEAAMRLRRPQADWFVRTRDHCAIVTNNMAATVERFFAYLKIDKCPYSARDIVDRPKPHLDALVPIDALWRNRNTVVIGDSPLDAQLAAAMGVDFLDINSLHP